MTCILVLSENFGTDVTAYLGCNISALEHLLVAVGASQN